MSDSKHEKKSLLDRVTKLQEEAESAQEGFSAAKQSGFSRWFQNLKLQFPFLAWISSLLMPIIKLLTVAFVLISSWFNWAAYERKDKVDVLNDNGERIFSSDQFLKRSLISIGVIALIHLSFVAIYFYSTRFDEIVYVTGKQEIETGELYQFGGCTSLPCSTDSDNGKFYLIESSFYFPKLYYPEEDVFANIPQQNAACTVEGYGLYFRNLRWIYKSAQLYQHVFSVSCRPYTDEELDRAIGAGIGS